MTNTNITKFRQKVFEYVNQAVEFNDVVNISTKNGNAIIISEDEYNSMIETLYLKSVPGLAESIKEASAEPLEDCAVYTPEEEW